MKAFPIPSYVNKSGETHDVQNQGMDLRDYFAAKAMQAIIGLCYEEFDILEDKGDLAENAYIISDAMMEARKK